MEETSITCDNCGRELIVDSKYPVHYILELSARNVNVNTSSVVHPIWIQPPVDGIKHYCGPECLSSWLDS